MKISACIIVKDEELCIDKCLTSIKGINEIVVLDTGSSDHTCEIARQYTDKVYDNEYAWEESFCKARNYALTKCTGDWVFVIDADEYFLDDVDKLYKAAEIADTAGHKTVNIVMIAEGSLSEFYYPRLFKRCPEVYFLGDVHNYLSITDNNKSNLRIKYGSSPTHLKDPDRSFRILLRCMQEKPDSIREAFYLAREYVYRHDWIKAIYWYQDYLKRAYWAPEWSEAYLMLARCWWKIDKNDEAKDACLQAIKINADYQEAIEFMAELCGPKNRAKWLQYAKLANSEDVMTVRKKELKE